MYNLKKFSMGVLAAGALAFGLAQNASAVAVDLELSLVIDVSGSISTSEYNLMMDGYANALKSATVQDKILNGAIGSIAVNTIFFASGAYTTSLDSFVLLDSAADIDAYANTLASFGRPGSGGTSIYTGTGKSLDILLAVGGNGFEGTRTVIDVSGDGASYAAADQAQRDRAVANQVTVNGISIGLASIQTYYQNNVITSDGFSIHTDSFAGFSQGISDKLIREISNVPEPASLALLGLGLLGFTATRRKKA